MFPFRQKSDGYGAVFVVMQQVYCKATASLRPWRLKENLTARYAKHNFYAVYRILFIFRTGV